MSPLPTAAIPRHTHHLHHTLTTLIQISTSFQLSCLAHVEERPPAAQQQQLQLQLERPQIPASRPPPLLLRARHQRSSNRSRVCSSSRLRRLGLRGRDCLVRWLVRLRKWNSVSLACVAWMLMDGKVWMVEMGCVFGHVARISALLLPDPSQTHSFFTHSHSVLTPQTNTPHSGVAVGSSIGHAVGGWFSGGSSSAESSSPQGTDFAAQHQDNNSASAQAASRRRVCRRREQFPYLHGSESGQFDDLWVVFGSVEGVSGGCGAVLGLGW